MRPLHLCSLFLPLLCACLSSHPSPLEAEPAEGAHLRPSQVLPQHHALAELAGNWRVEFEGQTQLAGGSGAARLSSLHGGRILRLELDVHLAGVPTQMTGHIGYDKEAGLWQALWFSDSSNGMSLLEGRGELDTGVHLLGERRGIRGRSVLKVLGPDIFTMEAYVPAVNGGDLLLRRTSYFRM